MACRPCPARAAVAFAAAHQQRAEGQRLAKLDLALPHQFEAGRKGRGHGGDALLGFGEVLGEVGLKRHPIHVLADQPLENFAGILQRPDGADDRRVIVAEAAFALHGIGLEQVVKAGFPEVAAADDDGFGLAPRMDRHAEPRPPHQLLRCPPHGLEPLQPELQQRRHHLAARLVVGCRLRHHQPALEVGEPGRHHQVIGGDLDALLAHRLDEGEVLLGKRQHRNLRQVDLLAPRQFEQQVERAFIAVDVHVKHLVVQRDGRLRIEPIGCRFGHYFGARLASKAEAFAPRHEAVKPTASARCGRSAVCRDAVAATCLDGSAQLLCPLQRRGRQHDAVIRALAEINLDDLQFAAAPERTESLLQRCRGRLRAGGLGCDESCTWATEPPEAAVSVEATSAVAAGAGRTGR